MPTPPCRNCKNEIIYKDKNVLKENRDICKSCFRSEWGKKMWNKKKIEGKVHHWKLKPARLGDTQSVEAREKMRQAHLKPENIQTSIETLNKINAIQKGENHPLWIKDRNLLKKGDRNGKDSACANWRIQVYRRDNFKCKIADENCKGKIEAHHILPWRNYPELRYNVNNGITVCHFHHPFKESEEKRLSPYFQSLISKEN